uniref:Uncharacterized protein n=1 Tax=Agrobacterium tumefaciens TaxID=358 RepID=Q44425_AGRTU|nr:unknown [Agrobacterium tumefaciens]
MGANGSAVDHLDVAIIGSSDGVHHSVPDACFPPSYESVVAGGSRTIAFGQVAPRRTGSEHPEDSIQHATVIDARHPSWLVG